jgi:hypothetical protein
MMVLSLNGNPMLALALVPPGKGNHFSLMIWHAFPHGRIPLFRGHIRQWYNGAFK